MDATLLKQADQARAGGRADLGRLQELAKKFYDVQCLAHVDGKWQWLQRQLEKERRGGPARQAYVVKLEHTLQDLAEHGEMLHQQQQRHTDEAAAQPLKNSRAWLEKVGARHAAPALPAAAV